MTAICWLLYLLKAYDAINLGAIERMLSIIDKYIHSM